MTHLSALLLLTLTAECDPGGRVVVFLPIPRRALVPRATSAATG